MKEPVRILIVEDDALVARDIQTRLRKIGYQADWIASTGEAAVKFALEMSPQIVLMDIQLGEGMDGVEAVEKILENSEIPIVYLTAYSDESSLARAGLTQPYGYVVKPIETGELRIAIEIALQRYSLQNQLNEANRRLSTTLASIGDGVIATDTFGIVKVADRVATSMLGKKKGMLIGEKIEEIFTLRSRDALNTYEILKDPATELLATKKERLSYSDVLLMRAKGPATPIDVTATMIVDDRNEPDGVVLVFRDITKRQVAEEYLRYLAYHDYLTGLPNRTLFYNRLNAAIAQSTRHSRNLALLFLDLDDFKTVNDSLGHDAGDMLLKQLAERLKVSVRDDDTVARLAGDEFIIILNDIASVSDVKDVAEKILKGLDENFRLGDTEIKVTASIGIALFPLHGTEAEKLVRYADTAMYLAKPKGKNAYAIYTADWKSELPKD
ncbi:diguanylate cyclase domain-containing protein [Leptospira alstonii]|uniref:Diguanylate cyclase (GGDEF) domain protein n=2 Tax=Leptospira alstonii TaxID=28452 RepID=M6D004_9LEPT|nr:diguanylate cyclase [Leptospira alstonii]EMJ96036.1 diguanylate cyclase (GGDEF) domain protein [Leptospira alstonii serovar Sichuan str. 79601]EQA79953.1 diguanylate cyclase (GGDEF) domain protein [Leptospira alstonii serovar Pingchang str. 80-412]